MSTLCECDLTVIVPVYNLEEYITPMLESLKSQRVDGYTWEIIFVNNNCTDRTEDVIRASGLECRILSCDIQGCGPARNTGIEAANGKYIWFLDGDDWLLSDTAVQDVLTRAKAEDLDILYIPFRSDTYLYQYFSMVCQYLLRREYVREFRFPAIQPAEDDAYMAAVLSKAGYDRYTYVYLPRMSEPLYYYNYGRPGSNMMRYYAGERI